MCMCILVSVLVSKVRVEAALASFGCIETTAPSLQERCGNDWLDSLATALAPDVGCKERLAATRRRLEAAIEGCFGLSRFEFFGSAVNGFETSSSDLDVVVLPREEALRRSPGVGCPKVSETVSGCRRVEVTDRSTVRRSAWRSWAGSWWRMRRNGVARSS